MLRTRVLTAMVLMPMLMWLLIYGPSAAVFILVLLVIALSVFEMAMMLQPRLDEVLRNYSRFDPFSAKEIADRKTPIYDASKRVKHYQLLAAFCTVVMGIIFSGTVYFDVESGRGMVVLGLMLTMLAGVFATRGIEAEMARVLGFVLTLVYAGFPWILIWDLYVKEPGAKQLILLLAIVWSGDTGGYFGGRLWGKTKLAPIKSPKKTWEGAVAGLVCSVAAAVVMNTYYYQELPGGIPVAMAAGFAGGIAGQMGDLVESVFKRFTQVKDSGALLPGHGGLLDRIDGVLFAAPVIWFILYWASLSL